MAYEMNGEPLPMLNGFPVRLVVLGSFATYWVKALSQITVRTEPLHNFWVDTAYRVPTTPGYSEDPKYPNAQTTPITRHTTRAVFLTPESSAQLKKTGRSRSRALPSMMAQAFGAWRYRQTAGVPGRMRYWTV